MANVSQYGFDLTPKITTTKSKKISRSTTPSLTQQYQKMSTEASTANKNLENEMRGLYTQNIDTYGKGGSFLESGYKDIASQENKIVGQETQNLISSGLYGTTVASSIPTRVASSFTQPSRFKLEDIANQRLTGAKSEFAQFLNTITNSYPDYNVLLEAMRAKGSV